MSVLPSRALGDARVRWSRLWREDDARLAREHRGPHRGARQRGLGRLEDVAVARDRGPAQRVVLEHPHELRGPAHVHDAGRRLREACAVVARRATRTSDEVAATSPYLQGMRLVNVSASPEADVPPWSIDATASGPVMATMRPGSGSRSARGPSERDHTPCVKLPNQIPPMPLPSDVGGDHHSPVVPARVALARVRRVRVTGARSRQGAGRPCPRSRPCPRRCASPPARLGGEPSLSGPRPSPAPSSVPDSLTLPSWMWSVACTVGSPSPRMALQPPMPRATQAAGR